MLERYCLLIFAMTVFIISTRAFKHHMKAASLMLGTFCRIDQNSLLVCKLNPALINQENTRRYIYLSKIKQFRIMIDSLKPAVAEKYDFRL